MLGKLLKYDLKNFYKFLIIFYALAILFATLTRILFNIGNTLFIEIIGQITNGAMISMCVSSLINNLMRFFVTFKTSLYGDEGYLIHTLPIERRKILASKFLLGIISLFTTIIVIGLAIFIAYGTKENIETVKQSLFPLVEIFDSTLIKILLIVVAIFFLETLSILMSGTIGLILGHKKLDKKVGWSVLFGFLTYLITQIIVLGVIAIVSIFSQNVNALLFDSNFVMDIGTMRFVLSLSGTVYTGIIIGLYLLGQKAFRKIDVA